MKKLLLLPWCLLCSYALAQDARKPEPQPDPAAAKAEDDRKALEERVRADAAAGGTRPPSERERRGADAGAGPHLRSHTYPAPRVDRGANEPAKREQPAR
ncbi:MAG: hypothetical protein ACT4P4_12225 [Betaproteobacteria bacterium]